MHTRKLNKGLVTYQYLFQMSKSKMWKIKSSWFFISYKIVEHFEYCTCTHVESYSINPLIPTIKIHTQMDTHRQLWCSWECNDQRQRPIHIAPVPRCRIIIEYDNTQLSLRIIQNATTRPHDTPTHARLIERARPQDIFSRHVFVLMDINFYKQASVLSFTNYFAIDLS